MQILYGPYDNFKGIRLSRVVNSRLVCSGAAPILAEMFCAKWVYDSDQWEAIQAVRRDLPFWVRHLPEDPILVMTAGWPEFGIPRDSRGGSAGGYYSLSLRAVLEQAMLRNPLSCLFDLGIVGSPVWTDGIPQFQRCLKFYDIDEGCLPNLLGNEIWVRSVIEDYRQFCVEEGRPPVDLVEM